MSTLAQASWKASTISAGSAIASAAFVVSGQSSLSGPMAPLFALIAAIAIFTLRTFWITALAALNADRAKGSSELKTVFAIAAPAYAEALIAACLFGWLLFQGPA